METSRIRITPYYTTLRETYAYIGILKSYYVQCNPILSRNNTEPITFFDFCSCIVQSKEDMQLIYKFVGGPNPSESFVKLLVDLARTQCTYLNSDTEYMDNQLMDRREGSWYIRFSKTKPSTLNVMVNSKKGLMTYQITVKKNELTGELEFHDKDGNVVLDWRHLLKKAMNCNRVCTVIVRDRRNEIQRYAYPENEESTDEEYIDDESIEDEPMSGDDMEEDSD